MPHNLDLILTLTGGLGAALALGFLTQKLRLSPIVGYLLAGVVVGPFTPGFVAHRGLAEQLAEVGVILLMFGVGLHFHVKELLAVRRVALPGALAQIGAATAISVLVAHLAGWSLGAGVVFGLAVSVASTVVLLRVLADYGALHTPSGHVAVGWLVVEDIFTVFVLVMLPLFAGEHAKTGAPIEVALSIGWAIVKIAVLIAFTLIVGQRVIPALLSYVSKSGSRELFTLTVLVLALGIAVGSAKLFGASMALGAFLAGMVVGQSDFSARAASEALPMRDAFAVLFFVSMGMLFDPAQILPNLGLIAATLAIVLVCKPLVAFLVVVLLRRPVAMAVTVSVALAQIGEFSFMLAALGRELGVLPASATQVLVVTAIVSVTANAILFRLVTPTSRWLSARLERKGREPADSSPGASEEHGPAVVVVGYGPVGRTVTRLLRDNGFIPTVVEMNLETVQQLNREGGRAVYGDASQSEILERAGIATASSLVYAASGTPPEATIALAKELNPSLLVLARATYISEMHALSKTGDVVVTAEVEVALSMTERLLERLGATREQLDRERDRVRSELASA